MRRFLGIAPLRAAALVAVLVVPMIVSGSVPGARAVETEAAEAAEAAVALRPTLAGIPHPLPPRRPRLGDIAAVFHAVDLRDWPRAERLAAELKDPVLARVVDWAHFSTRGERMDFDAVSAFIEAHPEWPRMDDMLANAEEALSDRIPDSRVIAWFEKHPPLGPRGAIRLAGALIAADKRAEAEALVRESWIGMNFDAAMERDFLRRFHKMLTRADHEKRLDRLLWDGRDWEARRMLRRVSPETGALAVARMRLGAFRGGVDWAIRRVPEALENDPGFVYERLRWRRRKGRDDEAIELLDLLPDTLPRPELLWREQGALARRALEDGKISLAYKLASKHRQVEGESFADAEFLAGFIALRFLKEPGDALGHFSRLYEKVNYPVSLARGAYWAGKAARQMGRERMARGWFARAAEHVTTFYGQLAVRELGDEAAKIVPPSPEVDARAADAFAQRELARAARLVALSQDRSYLKSFVRQMVRLARTPAEHALAVNIAVETARPDVAVWAAKDALKDGVHLIGAGWPKEPLPGDLRGLERAVLLSLMRQESAFDPDAVSWAGARGLMQVMPATGSMVARRLGLPFSRERLLADADYNMTIGSAYFAHVLEEFEGSYVLALAAYNAGPSRARRWLRDNGDFRKGEIDVVDWIELIPFEQTRDYVQRVIENVQVYRAVFDGGRLRVESPADLKG